MRSLDALVPSNSSSPLREDGVGRDGGRGDRRDGGREGVKGRAGSNWGRKSLDAPVPSHPAFYSFDIYFSATCTSPATTTSNVNNLLNLLYFFCYYYFNVNVSLNLLLSSERASRTPSPGRSLARSLAARLASRLALRWASRLAATAAAALARGRRRAGDGGRSPPRRHCVATAGRTRLSRPATIGLNAAPSLAR